MAFTPRPNTGTLWPNDRKSADNHPDVRGDLFLDRGLLQGLIRKTDDDLIKISVSGWNKTIVGKQCINIAASEPYVKREEKEEPAKKFDEDEDVPF
jgi:hypothetical protein